MSKQKVCLINPPTTDPMERLCYFPMALLTLGGVLKKCKTSAVLWDFDLYFKKIKNTTEKKLRKILRLGVEGAGTNIFCISSICSNFPMALWMAREIKRFKKDSLIILGGPQPSSVPERILELFDYVDLVVVGEGEVTLEEMVREEFNLARICHLPGVASRFNGQVRVNQKRPLVGNMDSFPLPDFSLIDFKDYIAHTSGVFIPRLEVGRGCPFHCTFCSTALMWEQNYRVKSPERILMEMENLYKNYGFRKLELIHDNFTTSRKFVYEFCDYMKLNNHRHLKWSVSSRTDCLDEKRLKAMADAGLWGLFFGIETGSDRMQEVIRKKLNFDHLEPILIQGNKMGLSITSAFILGFPEEEREDINATIKKALEYKCLGTTNVYFSKLTALTGTRIYRDYLPKLEISLQPSTISPQLYGLPYVRELICKYPDLFSSYYHIPHPNYSKDCLTRLVEFAQLFINGLPKTSQKLLETSEYEPLDLFRLWDQWCEQQSIIYYNYRAYSLDDFKRDFRNFLNQEILPVQQPAPTRNQLDPNSVAYAPENP